MVHLLVESVTAIIMQKEQDNYEMHSYPAEHLQSAWSRMQNNNKKKKMQVAAAVGHGERIQTLRKKTRQMAFSNRIARACFMLLASSSLHA